MNDNLIIRDNFPRKEDYDKSNKNNTNIDVNNLNHKIKRIEITDLSEYYLELTYNNHLKKNGKTKDL